jgi:hypothetical protein
LPTSVGRRLLGRSDWSGSGGRLRNDHDAPNDLLRGLARDFDGSLLRVLSVRSGNRGPEHHRQRDGAEDYRDLGAEELQVHAPRLLVVALVVVMVIVATMVAAAPVTAVVIELVVIVTPVVVAPIVLVSVTLVVVAIVVMCPGEARRDMGRGGLLRDRRLARLVDARRLLHRCRHGSVLNDVLRHNLRLAGR